VQVQSSVGNIDDAISVSIAIDIVLTGPYSFPPCSHPILPYKPSYPPFQLALCRDNAQSNRLKRLTSSFPPLPHHLRRNLLANDSHLECCPWQSAGRLSRRSIHSVKALGTVSVICSDKTGATRLLPCSVCQLKLVDPGTLTRNEPTITEFQVLRASRLASTPFTMT
jgi:hypothetical protein